MHPVDWLYPNHRKDFPGLDTIDYIEAMNPWVGRLYYSIVERFPKKQEVFTLVFLGFKKRMCRYGH